jgi:iron-sulfur cluster assembly accessory protein
MEAKGPITRAMNIQALADSYPEAVSVMAEKGLHCFGCHGASADSVESGAKGHGMDDAAIDAMVKEMNEMVAMKHAKKASAPAKVEFKITEKAAKKLHHLLVEEKKPNYGLRIAVVPGGCSGFSYEMAFEAAPKTDDMVFEKDGMKVFIDKESAAQLNGSQVDYLEGLHESGFKIENPNAEHKCGCGKSFS